VDGGIVRRAWADLRSLGRASLGLHLLMQLIGVALYTPAVTWISQRLVLASGEPVISNYDIATFAATPTGVLFVLVLVALSVGLLLGEFAGQTWIAGRAIAGQPATAAGAVAFVMRRMPALVQLSARIFLRLLLLALPFAAAAGVAWLALPGGHDINYYLAEQPPEWRRTRLVVLALAAGYALAAAWQMARWLYAVPELVFAGRSPREALARSAALTRGRLARIVPPLLLWWLLLGVVALTVTWAFRQLADAGLDWAGIDVRRVLPLVAVYLVVTLAGGLLYGGLLVGGHQFLVTRLYAEQLDAARLAVADPADREDRSRSVALRAVVATLVAVTVAGGVAWRVASRLDLDPPVAITAHRGASAVAPENSLAAFRAAMEAGATYAELDVQHTLDGRIVVVHDADLMRMAGDPRRVRELTAAEIATIDIGRRRDASFAGEVPPTLEQVIDLVRGRMKINVELKYNVPDPGLVPAVVEMLRREDFLDQVVVTSLDYAAMREVERLEPSLVTGHIVTAAVGDVARTEADFLSLNAARATPALVRRAHAAGKDVHVWTVNRPEAMLRMVERGVDNIITDDPARLVAVIDGRRALSPAELLGLRLRVLFDIPPRELTDPEAVPAL
jgi:glycerophosphoryl diester phosphodiesterase